MNQKHSQNIYANVNVTFMVENLIQIKSGISINVNMSAKIQKSTCTCKSGKYLENFIGDEIKELIKTVPTKAVPIKTIKAKIA